MDGKALMNKFGPAYRNAGLPEGVNVYQCQTASGGHIFYIPALLVPQAVENCGKRGVRSAVIIAGGFSEAGHEGDLFQQQTAEAERRFGISPLYPTAGGQ